MGFAPESFLQYSPCTAIYLAIKLQLTRFLVYRLGCGLHGLDAGLLYESCNRVLDHVKAYYFFYSAVGQARAGNLLAEKRLSVDGTLLEEWASQTLF